MSNNSTSRRSFRDLFGQRMLCRLSGLLTLCWFTVAAQALYAQNPVISLTLKNATVREVIEAVKTQSGYSFWYRESEIDLRKRVSVEAHDQNVLKLLDGVLADQGILAKLEGRHIVLYKSDPAGRGREYQLKGRVETEAGDPIVGANVLVEGTTNGMVTNSKGEFALNVTAGARLSVSFIGYDAAQVEVGNRTHLTVVLKENNQLLDDVVVIGYGVQKKVNLTGSVAVRQMSEIENQPMTHASQALYSMPGVYINQASSKPGSDGATIRIRGVGTMSSSSPMVLVDGMEYSLNELNPGDIETISVLKDASASIYGSKAANGVILITTKQAKKGAPVVKLSANFGIQSATYVPDVVTDPIQYMNMRNQAELNEGKLTVTYNRDDILEYEEGMKHDKYIYPASDWYDLCYQNGFLQQYNARVSGGTDKISYSLGGGYMNQRGIMVANDDAERFSWDMKINAQVTKRLKVGISLLGNLRYNTDPIYGVSTTVNVINRALPIFGTQLPDGKWLSTWLSTPGRNNPENPLMELHEGNTKRQLHRILGRINIGYDLPWGIKYNANLGYVKVDHYSKDFKHAMYTYNPKTLERKNFSAYVSAKDWDNNAINYTFYNTLSWGKSFGGNHNFNVMVGTEYKRYDGKNFQAKKRDYFNNQLTALSVGATMEDISGGSSLELLFSYFGRITYDYKEKYLIDVTARYDGSSKFAKGNRWAFFPAVSVGWRIDKENFMQNVRAVDVLKLRGSVGEMGNQAIGNYEYLMAVLANTSYNYSFGDVLSGGAAIKDFVDENISWETTRTYNLGLDFEAFDHRLLFSVDLYKKRTEGILRDVKIPAQIGNLNGPKQNIGVVANDGVELNLQWRSAVKNFHYSLGGNFCYNKNIVVDLDGQEYIKTFNIIREGEPIDAWYLYQADGFYNSYEEIANSVTVGSGVKPGYIRYKNLNNDDKIDNDDRAVCGNLTPSITYAFNFSLGWKGLELSAQFQGVADVKTYLSGNLAAPFWNGAGVLKEWATDAWTPENHNSRLPILHTATGAPEMHDYKNTQWLYDASYLRCKQLQLSYTLPKRWISKLGMSQCQIFVNGENLFTISPLKMFDPEIDLSSTNLMQYPSLRTINFGFNITF